VTRDGTLMSESGCYCQRTCVLIALSHPDAVAGSSSVNSAGLGRTIEVSRRTIHQI